MELQLIALLVVLFVAVATAIGGPAVAADRARSRRGAGCPKRDRRRAGERAAVESVLGEAPSAARDAGPTRSCRRSPAGDGPHPAACWPAAGYHGDWPAILFSLRPARAAAAGRVLTVIDRLGTGAPLLLGRICGGDHRLLPAGSSGSAARSNGRRREIRNGLPDAIDLLIVCIEAGSGIDQALAAGRRGAAVSPTRRWPRELELITTETRAGKPRIEAFKNFAERTKVDDVRSLVAMLVQTDRFGTSLGQALRTHAETSRTKRRQRAEERAAKLGVKLLFPLVFCLFPAFYRRRARTVDGADLPAVRLGPRARVSGTCMRERHVSDKEDTMETWQIIMYVDRRRAAAALFQAAERPAQSRRVTPRAAAGGVLRRAGRRSRRRAARRRGAPSLASRFVTPGTTGGRRRRPGAGDDGRSSQGRGPTRATAIRSSRLPRRSRRPRYARGDVTAAAARPAGRSRCADARRTTSQVAAAYRSAGMRDRAFDYLDAGLHAPSAEAGAARRAWPGCGATGASPSAGCAASHRAVCYAPRSAEARNTLGTVLWALGQRAEAPRAFAAATRSTHARAYAWHNLCASSPGRRYRRR